MKLKKILVLIGAGGAAWGTYLWLAPASPEAIVGTHPVTLDMSDPKNKAVAEMAKFLETAPIGQLKAMSVIKANASNNTAPPWSSLLPYTQRAKNGVWIAQVLSLGGPLGSAEEAKKSLFDNPESAVADMKIVLDTLPPEMPDERAKLIDLLGEAAQHVEDRAPVEEALLKESQKPTALVDSSKGSIISQAEALTEYYKLVPDRAKQAEAYKAALEAQTDPVVKEVLQRFEVKLGQTDRKVAGSDAQTPPAPEPAAEKPKDPEAAPQAGTPANEAPAETTQVRDPASETPQESPESTETH